MENRMDVTEAETAQTKKTSSVNRALICNREVTGIRSGKSLNHWHGGKVIAKKRYYLRQFCSVRDGTWNGYNLY